MDRRKFLKIAGAVSIVSVVSPALLYAKRNIKRAIEAVKKGKYPGKIKKLDENIVKREGKWLG